MKKNILFITEKWVPEGGGAEIFFYELANRVVSKGFKVTVISDTKAYSSSSITYTQTILRSLSKKKILAFSGLFYRLLFMILLFPTIISIIKKEKIHLIHTLTPLCSIPAFFAGKLTKRRVIVSIRAYSGRKWFNMVKNPIISYIYYLLEKLSIRFPYDCVITANKDIFDDFPDLLHSERGKYITPNAVDILQFNPDIDGLSIRQELSIDPTDFLILYASTIAKTKGVYFLVDAFKLVHEHIPSSKLLFVGDGVELASLIRYTRSLGLLDSVVFLGRVLYEKMPKLYSACDVVVRPGLSEGVPRVVMEALACGKPVVATDVGGTKELVINNKTGLLVEPMDIESLASKIIKIADNPNLANMFGKNGRKLIESKFTWKVIMKDLLPIYDRLMYIDDLLVGY